MRIGFRAAVIAFAMAAPAVVSVAINAVGGAAGNLMTGLASGDSGWLLFGETVAGGLGAGFATILLDNVGFWESLALSIDILWGTEAVKLMCGLN